MCLEALPQNLSRLITAPHLVAGLFPGLLHQFLMARQALPQLLQPFAELIPIARLVFELIPELVAQLRALLIRAGRNFLLLVAQLLLIFLAGLSHVLDGVFHFGRQTLLQTRPILFQIWAAGLEAILILLLHALRAATARSRSIRPLRHRDSRRTSQTGDGDDE
jgi:hypothetical protein